KEEDGIRADLVTGVQRCALPLSPDAASGLPSSPTSRRPRRKGELTNVARSNTGPSEAAGASSATPSVPAAPAPASATSRLRVKRDRKSVGEARGAGRCDRAARNE